MALKGTATIELTNADGSKDIIKHDNMITNAVNDLCLSQRGEMSTILKIVKNNDSYAQAMFGGLLLFDEVLNDYADDYFIPTTKITGYASQDAYAGLDVARGSFNQSEGGVQEDGGYKFVWDFSTSQGNGTIKSLGLCLNKMGQIGASDAPVYSERQNFYITNSTGAPFDTSGYMLTSGGTTNGIYNYRYIIVATIGNIAYAIDIYNVNYNSDYSPQYVMTNGGVLRLYKFDICTTSISLAGKAGMANYLGYVDVQLPTEFTNILHTETLSSSDCVFAFFYDYATSKLTLFPCQKKADIAVNGTTKYVDIDLANDMSISVSTFTNNTAGKILKGARYYRGGTGLNFFVCKDYIVNFSVVGSVTKMYVTKRSDNTQVTEVKYVGGGDFSFSTTSAIYFMPLIVNGNMFVFRYAVDSGDYYTYILDMSNGKLKKTNANGFSSTSVQGYLDIGSKMVYAGVGNNLKYELVFNPFVLTTKNNLDSPVTKTSSQTMKITYTLSEVEV